MFVADAFMHLAREYRPIARSLQNHDGVRLCHAFRFYR
jgi:hypothetical protein